MPHPGDIVRKGEFKGETQLLHPDFVSNLKVLIPSLLEHTETKYDAAGNSLTCAQLCEYFKVSFYVFSGLFCMTQFLTISSEKI